MKGSRKDATIRDVAERAGVSISTVSHVVNKTRRVEDSTRARIVASIAELDYRPNLFARGLRGGGSKTIGLIISDIREDFFSQVTKAIESAANEKGFTVFLCDSEEDPERERLYLDMLSDKGVDGIVMAPVDVACPPRLGRGRRLPLVQVDRRCDGAGLDFVGIDNARHGAAALRHLAALGRSRVGFAGHESSISTMRDRARGVRGAAEALGAWDEKLLLWLPSRGSDHRARLRRWLSSARRPDAVICGNSNICFSVMGALDELGLALPGDVALVSFDDPACFPLMRCPVSAIRQPTDRIGRAAFAAILARIEGRAGPEPVDLLLPARFVPRESCGAARAGNRRKTATAVERR